MLTRIQENAFDPDLERLLAWLALGPDDEDPDDDEDDDEDEPKGPPVNN
ncbi:MAG: hypothetical protein P8Y69_15530 [Gammaproteobacteria bacterium]|jgi:hypothetical protein